MDNNSTDAAGYSVLEHRNFFESAVVHTI